MKLIREIILLVMLSFVTPTINAMSILAAPQAVITLTMDRSLALRSRHRVRRYGYAAMQSEFTFVHQYVAI